MPEILNSSSLPSWPGVLWCWAAGWLLVSLWRGSSKLPRHGVLHCSDPASPQLHPSPISTHPTLISTLLMHRAQADKWLGGSVVHAHAGHAADLQLSPLGEATCETSRVLQRTTRPPSAYEKNE
jgi:hypothetical protein